MAELQSHLSAVCSKRDDTGCPCEATQVDAELFQSQVERLECERCEVEVSKVSKVSKNTGIGWLRGDNHIIWLAERPTRTVGAGRGTPLHACRYRSVYLLNTVTMVVACMSGTCFFFHCHMYVRCVCFGRWSHMLPQSQGSCLH